MKEKTSIGLIILGVAVGGFATRSLRGEAYLEGTIEAVIALILILLAWSSFQKVMKKLK
jgi:hypothetical protein